MNRIVAIVGACALTALSGCQLFSPPETPAAVLSVPTEMCLVAPPHQGFAHNCNLTHWLRFWADANQLNWSQRKDRILQLGDSLTETLYKVLLSQGASTPYQDRLRAQGWLDSLLGKLTPPAQSLFGGVLREPAQDLLEFESALAVMARINAKQEGQIKQQQRDLAEKQRQIEQLLKIEASMIDEQKD